MDLKEAVKDKIPWDGTLSLNDFSLSASTFSDKWKMFNPSFPPWLWTSCRKHHLSSSHKVEGYLSLENVRLVKSGEEEESKENLTWKEQSNISQTEEPFDHATLVCPEYEANHYDFHIVYCPSYRVPVLYFRSYYSDGQPLPLSEIEKDLPGHSAELLVESKWTFITQEEHPYLNRPWYKLHPCGTRDWMKLLLSDTYTSSNNNIIEQYLVSWFSVVGQVVETVNRKAMNSIFLLINSTDLLSENSAPIPLSRPAVQWVPLVLGRYKLNVDDAGQIEDSNWCRAVVVRDSNRVVVCWLLSNFQIAG